MTMILTFFTLLHPLQLRSDTQTREKEGNLDLFCAYQTVKLRDIEKMGIILMIVEA